MADVENDSNGGSFSPSKNDLCFESDIMESKEACLNTIFNVHGPSGPTFDTETFSDSDWVDSEKFFSSMDGEASVIAECWDDKDKNDTSFVAESLGEGDWVNGETFFNKNEEPEKEDILRFDFGDDSTDCFMESIAELYTYSEVPEFEFNMRSFEDVLRDQKIFNTWQAMTPDERQSLILRIIDLLDVVDPDCRVKAKSSLLYIAQGCWREMRCLKNQQEWAIYNISLLMKNGVFDSILELLYFEVEKNAELIGLGQLGTKMDNMADSYGLRLTLNLLYTMVETVRCNRSLHSFLPYIKAEISEQGEGKKLLATLLFDMLGDFARNKKYSHFPIKKIVLLLWKVILISLGGEKELRQLREQRRANSGLPSDENSGDETTKILEGSQGKSLREKESDFDKSKIVVSKVTKKEMDDYLRRIADKYVGKDATVLHDENAELLFPACINEVVKTLKDNVYVSLADVQRRFEEKKTNFPYTDHSQEFDCIEATEALYASLLPNLKLYAKGITKVLSLVAPTTSWRTISEVVPPHRSEWFPTDNVIRNIDATRYKEIVFKALSAITLLLLKHTKINHFLQFEHLSQELVKADAILGFFSFFKVDSLVYILKQNYSIERYNFPNCVLGNLPEVTIEEIRSRSAKSHCQRSAVLGYINAARILNKLTKGKPHRGIYMAHHNFYNNLIEALKIKEPAFQNYIGKLLKLQIKYVKTRSKNENDRKRFITSKLVLLTDIYGKIRTNLTNEKWFYFAEEEYEKLCDLRCSFLEPTTQNLLRHYHKRKYNININVDKNLFSDYDASDPDCKSVSLERDYGEEELFKKNYERWLDIEVFNNPIDWDQFLKDDSNWK